MVAVVSVVKPTLSWTSSLTAARRMPNPAEVGTDVNLPSSGYLAHRSIRYLTPLLGLVSFSLENPRFSLVFDALFIG